MKIRSLKPEVLSDERVATLSLAARVLWYGCLSLADDHGRLRADPRYLHGQVFWGSPENVDVAVSLHELADCGLLQLYQVRGQRYASIPTWHKHQRISNPAAPVVPAPGGQGQQELLFPQEDTTDESREDPRDPSRDRGPRG